MIGPWKFPFPTEESRPDRNAPAAPEDGYQPQLAFKGKVEGKHLSGISEWFFVKSRGGCLYSRVHLKVAALPNGGGNAKASLLEYSTNPSGSRGTWRPIRTAGQREVLRPRSPNHPVDGSIAGQELANPPPPSSSSEPSSIKFPGDPYPWWLGNRIHVWLLIDVRAVSWRTARSRSPADSTAGRGGPSIRRDSSLGRAYGVSEATFQAGFGADRGHLQASARQLTSQAFEGWFQPADAAERRPEKERP